MAKRAKKSKAKAKTKATIKRGPGRPKGAKNKKKNKPKEVWIKPPKRLDVVRRMLTDALAVIADINMRVKTIEAKAGDFVDLTRAQGRIWDMDQRLQKLEKLCEAAFSETASKIAYNAAVRDHQLRGGYGAGSFDNEGCVCPVGAEATCKGFNCPRRSRVPVQGTSP